MTRICAVLLSLGLSVFMVLGAGCDKADDTVQVGLTVEPQHFYLPPDKELATPVFSLVNNSSTVIHILDVKSSCGCAAPKLPSSYVLPGQRIQLSVDAIRPAAGANSATVTLLTDSRITPVVKMTSTMAAKGDGGASVFEVEPRRIVLERRIGNDSPSPVQILSIKSIEQSPDRFVKGVECDLPGLMIREHSVTASRPLFGSNFVERQYKFLIEIDPKFPVGSYYGNITLTTKAKSIAPNHRIDISLIIDGHIVATPRSVFARVSNSEMPKLPMWNVRLNSAHGRIQIESVDAGADWLMTTVAQDNSEQNSANIQIRATSVPPDETSMADVIVRTTDQDVVRIPVVLTRPRRFSPTSVE